MTLRLRNSSARTLWLRAQRLAQASDQSDQPEPFGDGPPATQAAIEHLGYVQIDTINVIERCHHHILYNRIPRYRRADLEVAQAKDKSVFEYWTHALSYLPTRDFSHYVRDMKQTALHPGPFLQKVPAEDLRKLLRLIRKEGPISIRDIKDEVLIEKDHLWASRKPSKRALQFGFYSGRLVISSREGMLKKYELTTRHFAWPKLPRPASQTETLEYHLNRALRAQAFVSLRSIVKSTALRQKLLPLIHKKVAAKELVEVQIEGYEKQPHWLLPETWHEAQTLKPTGPRGPVHILSPFDPLVIQRDRLKGIFSYEHLFEAYIPASKRKLGYFALPILQGDQIVAAIDLKTDRQAGRLLVQKWTWLPSRSTRQSKTAIESALHLFEKFQLAKQ